VIDFSGSKYFRIKKYDADIGDYLLEKRWTGDRGTYEGKPDEGYKGPFYPSTSSGRTGSGGSGRTGSGDSGQTGSGGLKLWIAAIVDDYSGAAAARYFTAPGESFIEGLDFVKWLWSGPEGSIFKGAPEILYGDQGSFLKSGATEQLCAALDIRILKAEKKHAWAKGKIEAFFRWTWPKFELMLAALVERGIYFQELNGLLMRHLERRNRMPHRYWKGFTKEELYLTSLQRTGFMAVPADIERYAYNVLERTVRDGLVSLDGELWQIAGASPEGEKVRVYKNARGEVRLRTGDGEILECVEFTPLKFGDYKGRPLNEREKLMAAAAAPGLEVEDLPFGGEGEERKVVFMGARSEQVAPTGVFTYSESDEYGDAKEAKAAFLRDVGEAAADAILRSENLQTLLEARIAESLKKRDISALADEVRTKLLA